MVYFVQSGNNGPIKIGFSEDVNGRLSNLQSSSPAKLTLLGFMAGDRIWERKLHEKFQHLNVSGEWFQPEPELLDFVTKAKRIVIAG